MHFMINVTAGKNMLLSGLFTVLHIQWSLVDFNQNNHGTKTTFFKLLSYVWVFFL